MIRQRPDGSFHAIRVFTDPATGQEVAFAGEGRDRESCLRSLDAAISTGLKAFPGLKRPNETEEPRSRRYGFQEPQKAPLWVRSTVVQADGRKSTRVIDYNDRDARRKFRRAGETALESGGSYHVEASPATLEGVLK